MFYNITFIDRKIAQIYMYGIHGIFDILLVVYILHNSFSILAPLTMNSWLCPYMSVSHVNDHKSCYQIFLFYLYKKNESSTKHFFFIIVILSRLSWLTII